MGPVATLPDNNLRVTQKQEVTAPIIHEQLLLWGLTEPTLFSDEHPLQAGPTEDKHIRLGGNVIQAAYTTAASDLELNPYGGGVSAPDMRGKFVRDDGGASSTFVSVTWIPSNGNIPEVGYAFTAPPSGAVWIDFCAKLSTSVAGTAAQVTIEVYDTDTAGAVVVPAAPPRAIEVATTNVVTGHWQHSLDTLTPGQQYYVRLMFKMANSATGTIWGRTLAVIPRL